MPGRVCAGATLALAMFREAARISIPLPGWGAEGQGNRKVKVHWYCGVVSFAGAPEVLNVNNRRWSKAQPVDNAPLFISPGGGW